MNTAMNATERRTLVSLASLYALRMLGLFMVLPVMFTYGDQLVGATPFLLGMALGIYGATQAVFQVPLGWLSDRVGRKPVIAAGLMVFALGSLLAAASDSIFWVVVGRALQGAGAIASSTMALLTDLTREHHRTKALAVVGITIGLSFTLAMMLGPWLAVLWGLSGIFYLTAGLAMLGVLVVYGVVPAEPERSSSRRTFRHALGQVAADPHLQRLNFGVFSLHLVLMALFVVVPLGLVAGGLEKEHHGTLYIPVMIVAFLLMAPLMIVAERKQQAARIFSFSVALLLAVSMVFGGFGAGQNWWFLALGLVVFFIGFNYLEASMPSLLSRLVVPELKGTAMGLFSTSQFLGASVGGMLGGWIYQQFGPESVYFACGGLMLIWFALSLKQKIPGKLQTLDLPNPTWHAQLQPDQWLQQISESLELQQGVERVSVTLVGDTTRVEYRAQHPHLNKEQLMRAVSLESA